MVEQNLSIRVQAALGIAAQYGQTDGNHHKMWVIDQMVRALSGPDYCNWVAGFNHGDEGPDTYFWDVGNPP